MIVPERYMVAQLLAGDDFEGPATGLNDGELRAVAVAVRLLTASHQVPTDEAVLALVRLQGRAGDGGDLEQLRREGALRRAA